jgi:hypothetical protein
VAIARPEEIGKKVSVNRLAVHQRE